MKKLAVYLAAAVVLFGLAAAVFAQKAKKHRVVIDVTMAGPDAWAPVLNGIENVQKGVRRRERRNRSRGS